MGRRKVKIGDRVVTGYRKTDRRNPRQRLVGPHRFTLTFQLPPMLAWSTTAGQVDSFVIVDERGIVTVSSFDRALTRRRARRFIEAITGELDVEIDLGQLSAVPVPFSPSGRAA